jgi:uncharacterized membrane protein
MTDADIHHKTPSSLSAGIILGIGLMAAVDEIIFHQLLSWHHFYDRDTPAFALLTDGLLHAAELILLVAGFFMLANLRGERLLIKRKAWAGFFIGLGGFQIFDGLIDHKVLRLHQIRYGIANLLTYDIAWNLSGVMLLAIGIMLLTRSRADKPAHI